MNPNTNKRYLNEKQVAELTSLSLAKLRNDRLYNRGIPYIKLNKSVRYSLEDVLGYMDGHKVEVA